MTNQSSISASAPGSLMLLGEHAVLHGRRALVCAISKRITITRDSVPEPVLRIGSVLGSYESPLDALEDHPDFRFVIDAVKQYSLEKGVELKIESEFSSEVGFGSSAAVTVATHAALMKLVGTARRAVHGRLGEASLPLEELFQRSLATIHRVQGRGSGADVAASVFGGVVAYRTDPLEIQPIAESFPLTAVYSGSKMKTIDVIKIVEKQRKADPEKYERIFDEMDASVGRVVDDFELLGKKLIENQFLMEEMGLCSEALAEIIAEFQKQGIPAKISGSGLGDCAIGLGDFQDLGNFPVYNLMVSADGIRG